MKAKYNIFKYTVTAALAMASFTAQAGSETRNGGDYLASQFFRTAQRVLSSAIQASVPSSYYVPGFPNRFTWVLYTPPATMRLEGIDLTRLQNTLDSIRVVSTDEVLRGPDGKPRDAVNDPKTMHITFNSDQWIDHAGTPLDQLSVTMHEVATLAGMDTSDNYGASQKLLRSVLGAGYKAEKLVVGVDSIEKFHQDLSGIYSCNNRAGKKAVDVSIQSDQSATTKFSGSKVTFYYPNWDVNAFATNSFGQSFDELNNSLSCEFTPENATPRPYLGAYGYINSGELEGKRTDAPTKNGVFKIRLIGRSKIRITMQGCAVDQNRSILTPYWQNRMVTLTCLKQ